MQITLDLLTDCVLPLESSIQSSFSAVSSIRDRAFFHRLVDYRLLIISRIDSRRRERLTCLGPRVGAAVAHATASLLEAQLRVLFHPIVEWIDTAKAMKLGFNCQMINQAMSHACSNRAERQGKGLLISAGTGEWLEKRAPGSCLEAAGP